MLKQEQATQFQELIDAAQTITIVQAENPDADSLGAATALAEILRETGKETHLYCATDVPKYLRYVPNWEHVAQDYTQSDLVILVDCSAESLIEKALEHIPRDTNWIALDHHRESAGLSFAALSINDPNYIAASQLVIELAQTLELSINKDAATSAIYGIMGDSLGLSSTGTTPRTFRVVAELLEMHDLNNGELDAARRELSKKSHKIFNYKQELLRRVEFHFDNTLATVEIPLEEIKEYSDQYNPGALFIEEMRSIEGLQVAIAFKVYDDKITGKLREIYNAPICDAIAEQFGGGGNPYAAGFKVQDTSISELKPQVLKAFYEALQKASA